MSTRLVLLAISAVLISYLVWHDATLAIKLEQAEAEISSLKITASVEKVPFKVRYPHSYRISEGEKCSQP